MHTGFIWEMAFLARLLGAGLCGAAIGYERTARLKEAGIRTHLIVAMGASLMMIVSKYGFDDVIVLDGVALDPSRVAAGIVSGVGFLGAGMIFVRDRNITGLTTAAGIWATAGIGMAIGSGLYIVGVLGTAMIYVIQIILHRQRRWLRTPFNTSLTLRIAGNDACLESIRDALEKDCQIIGCKAGREPGETMLVEFTLKTPNAYNYANLLFLMKNNPDIKSMEF